MPRRSLLSAEQRSRLFDVPTTPAEMAKHYVLSPDDLLLVRAREAPRASRRSVHVGESGPP